MHLCYEQGCLDTLNFKANDGAIPVVWLSMDDYINHDEATEEITKTLVGDVTITAQLAREVGDYLWGGDTMGQMFHDALDDSLGTLEELYVQNVKDKELPLIKSGSLTTEKGKLLLEKRLKGE